MAIKYLHCSLTLHDVGSLRAEFCDHSEIRDKQIVSKGTLRLFADFNNGDAGPAFLLFGLSAEDAQAYAEAINDCRVRLRAAKSEAA